MGKQKQKNKQRFERGKRNLRARKRRILICVEGENTESQYFELLQQHLKKKELTSAITIKVVKPKGTDPASILRGCRDYAEKEEQDGKGYDECFCVVDVDAHATLNQALRDAQSHSISMVVTNLKFELWLLWHVGDKPGGYAHNQQLDALVKKLSKSGETPFLEGNNYKNLHRNFPVENYTQAIEIACQKDPKMAFNRKGQNPSSAMPLLIEKLMK